MADPHYTPSGKPRAGAFGASQDMREEFQLVEQAFQALNEFPICVLLMDVNTAGSRYVTMPWAGKIVKVWAVNSTENSTAATTLTLEIGGIEVTMPTLQWAADAPIATPISSVPTALNEFVKGGAIEIITDGGGSGVMPATMTLVMERT